MQQKQDALLARIEARSGEYRPLPFWSWNDKLEAGELTRQIGEMSKQGLGGYFMHARGGIETAYLTKDWFDAIGTGVENAEREGMAAWIYDESGWPSGFAGGEVTALGDRYHARGLELHTLDSASAAKDLPLLLGIYQLDGNGVLKQVGEDAVGKVLAVVHTVSPYYIDILNPEVTKKFIEFTHDRYYARFGENFGKEIKGFFTDEPRLSQGMVPWSYILPDEFKNRYGYDILPVLPLLFVEARGYEKVRTDFWELVNHLFVHGYMKQLFDWCTEHDCELTGHMMMEESLYSQMTGTGGNMPFYEFFHMPGVDWLRRTIRNSVVGKQVGSAAEQLGKKRVLTESYALCGWDVNFQELRRIAEWQYVNGVNVMCQHLQGYTLRGLRKRDYPPSLFLQQSWWDEYKPFNDYLARVGALLTEGEKQIDVLLLHPMRSAWIAYGARNTDDLQKLDDDLEAAVASLERAHVDYHFGDETIMQRHGSIENGRLRVGNCAYRTVVVPPVLSLSPSTKALLEGLVEAGGQVLYVDAFPQLCGGVPDESLRALADKSVRVADFDALSATVSSYTDFPLRIYDQSGDIGDIRACRVYTQGQSVLYLVNLAEHKPYTAKVEVPGDYVVERLDLTTMQVHPVASDKVGENTVFTVDFCEMSSCQLLLTPGAQAALATNASDSTIDAVPGDWKIAAMDENSLTLDKCAYRIDGGEWQQPIAVIHLMKKLLELKRPCDIELRFSFEIREGTGITRLMLAMEQPELYKISVNGASVPYTDIGYWKDTSFKRLDIFPHIRLGQNVIELSGQFYQRQKVYDVLFGEDVYETELNQLTYDTELESMYLIGDFGAYSAEPYTTLERNALRTGGHFYLTSQPDHLRPGDFTTQGLLFFAGKVTLEKKITVPEGGRVRISFGKPRAALLCVRIDGQSIGKLYWMPFELTLPEGITPGEHTLSVDVYASNRNLLGPHHHAAGELYGVGPVSFTGEWNWCDKISEALPTTPEERLQNFWRDDYAFVTFGIGVAKT